ncbi:tetratricopeptide repeat protein [Candidatus Woesebacteria bacterium]|nr:tetratricopeptide repeat protein [Candidatus Woesebacteria bacterium]
MKSFLQQQFTKHTLFFLLLGFSFLVYVPSLNNQLFWDDEQFIYNNAYVKNFEVKKIFTTNTLAGAGETSNYYRPITTLSFAIDHLFWKINPIGYHLTNTVLHLVAGALLFILLKSLKMNEKPAVIITGIFLLHPIQTEAVVYANSRGDSLYTVWMFAGLLSLVFAIQKKRLTFSLYNLSYHFDEWFFALLVTIFFILSLLSKEIALGSILLYGVVFFHLTHNQKRGKAPALTALGVSLLSLGIYGWLRMTSLKFQDSLNAFAGTNYGESVIVRIATFAKVLLIYISLLLFPNNLHMERTTDVVTSLFSIYSVGTVAFTLIMGGLAWYERKNQKSSWIGFGLAWFFTMLLPVSGIFPLNDIMYEHWLYVPMIGFFIMVYGILQLGLNRLQKPWPPFTKLAIGTLFACYAIMTLRQNYIWGKATRFYPYILKYQNTARVHNNLAMAYAEEQQLEKAIEHYKKAIEISDVYPQTHYNLARSYAAQKEYGMAIQEFEIALEMSPKFGPAYMSLIQVLVQTNDIPKARRYYQQFAEQFPTAPVLTEIDRLLTQQEKTKK